MLKKGNQGVDIRFEMVLSAKYEVNHRDEQNWQIDRERTGR